MTHIGEIYFYGQGTERDYFKAERYFLTAVEHYAKAALPNDGQAYYYLGLIYYFGHCGKKNISQAVEYLNKSITFGNEYAMHRLAGIYLDKEVADVSGEEIVKLLEQTDDWDIIAPLYLYGNFVERNVMLAAKYFQKAADKGDIESAWQLAEIYHRGVGGIPKDENKAQFYYRQVFEKYQSMLPTNDSEIASRMWNMYASGLGVEVDEIKDEEFMEQANFLDAHQYDIDDDYLKG